MTSPLLPNQHGMPAESQILQKQNSTFTLSLNQQSEQKAGKHLLVGKSFKQI